MHINNYLSLSKPTHKMTDQNFSNHKRTVPGFHILLSLLLMGGLVLAIVNVFKQWQTDGLFTALLTVLVFGCLLLVSWFVRVFPLKAQDRAIRAEEGLRYFILTRQSLNAQLTIGQIAALRFAPDEELVPLVERVLAENLQSDDIKKAIQKWRADHHRV
jgi:hypothetical protein